MDSDKDWQKLSVARGYARLLSEWLKTQPRAFAPLLKEIEATPSLSRVPLQQWQQWLAGLETRGVAPEQMLGIGALIQFRHLGLLGHLAGCCQTVGELLQTYLRFETLQYGFHWAELSAGPPTCVRWRFGPGQLEHALLLETIGLSTVYSIVAGRLGMASAITAVDFTCAAPGRTQAYEDFFRCPVRFDQPAVRVEFSEQGLATRIAGIGSRPQVRLTEAAEQAASAASSDDDFVQRVLDLIQRHLHEGGALLPKASAALGIAPRSLQARLARAGWSFQDLVDTNRQQAALYYLSDPGLSYAETALLIGFSEQSVFSRAFHKWFPETPEQWRRRVLAA
ncbi:MAG TPA: AraC family transcriptional regulator ligand-binding domain-containing protein [Solimonas sp.]|nr:AraC family transcriptional regulator ligand-binding domain-containing protein [Solimonas sp.]